MREKSWCHDKITQASDFENKSWGIRCSEETKNKPQDVCVGKDETVTFLKNEYVTQDIRCRVKWASVDML